MAAPGGLGGRVVKKAEGFGLFEWLRARIHIVHEANKATNKITSKIPKAKANLEGERQSKSSSFSSFNVSSLDTEDAATASTSC